MSKPHRPVTSLLNALVLACLVPGILAVAAFSFVEYREERARLASDNLNLARALGETIDGVLLRDQELVAQLVAADEAWAAGPDADIAKVFGLASLERRVLYRLEGDRAVRVAGGPGTYPGAPDAAAVRTLRQGRIVVTGVLAGALPEASAVVVRLPLVRAGRVDYALDSIIGTSALTATVKKFRLRDGWLGSLLDPDGRIAGRSRNADKFVGQAADTRLRTAVLSSDSGHLSTVTRDGVANLTAYVRSPRTGYTAVVGVPRAQVVAPLLTELSYLGAIAALLFGAGILMARYLARRITTSIHALTVPASALGHGEPVTLAQMHLTETVEVGLAIERAAALLQERAATLRAQQEDLHQFKFFSENANEMLLLLDEEGNIRYANRRTSTRLGYSNAELLRMTLFQIDLPTRPERLRFVFDQCREAQPPPFERVYTCKDGSAFPVEITATVLQHRGEWLMHVAPRDIGERRQAEQAVRWAASHDALTGIANRARALAFLQDTLGDVRAGAPGGVLLYVDLDRFKPVNDNHGHETGDRVLQEVAHRLQSCLREGELLARFGGDEFVCVLPCLNHDPAEAGARAQALMRSVAQPIKLGNIEVQLSACIGISCFPEHGTTANELIHAADMAMLHVKHHGRAAYAFYSRDMDVQAQFIRTVERRLQGALDKGGLVLHYQPLVDLASGRAVGVEALVRLADGVIPPLGPAEFVPVAESCGLIGALGEWVTQAACRQQVRWEEAGLPLTVAVNVSALQFRRPDFAGHIRTLIASSGIDPQRLVIEVTETAVMEDLSVAIGILDELKSLGVRIALDDFGTGYSSLSSLSSLPLDKLKIDQSFVRGIAGDHAARAVIDAVIALATSLGLELVAEGIETEDAMRYLRERGCHQGQGYYFSRPLPEAELPAWLQRHQLAWDDPGS